MIEIKILKDLRKHFDETAPFVVRRTYASPSLLVSPYSTEKSLCDAGAVGLL
eukprot:COSAG03_NODE_1773_length_3540_cov_16.784946_5_plen_52_part_00